MKKYLVLESSGGLQESSYKCKKNDEFNISKFGKSINKQFNKIA